MIEKRVRHYELLEEAGRKQKHVKGGKGWAN